MASLSADLPSSNPKDDLFGHAPFSKSLADSISRYSNADNLVLALYGPWGSGKSTVLNYVKYYLEQQPADLQPVIVTFNPWWFSGQENLARAFLGQLQAVLPTKGKQFKELGDLLGDFAEGVGGVIDLTGMTGGAGKPVGKLVGSFFKRKPKDVPALKSEICKVLEGAGKRILVIIDDIDRLMPEETRQLFTVIKALTNFPNVVYLLAFDREVAVQAIEGQCSMAGDRYLEKIIQVPFELPPIDRTALRAALFKRLDEVLGDTPEGLFDQSYWTNVFFDGIDPLIQVPRDVVRFANTLSVTYPAVNGEVNPVDFIALEALRVFLPEVYGVIRADNGVLVGQGERFRYAEDANIRKKFREQVDKIIPEALRTSTMALLERIFPTVSETRYGGEWLSTWRRDLRACHPDIFPVYFRLTVPLGSVSRSEISSLLSFAGSAKNFSEALVQAKGEKRPDGLSKARGLLERLDDHVEKDISGEHIPSVVSALLDVGDFLINPDEEQGLFDVGNEIRVARMVNILIGRLSPEQCVIVLNDAITSGRAVVVQLIVLVALENSIGKSDGNRDFPPLNASDIEQLKMVWLERLRQLSVDDFLLENSELSRILAYWKKWGSEAETKHWCSRIIATDSGFFKLLTKFLRYRRSQTLGDRMVQREPYLEAGLVEGYIDIHACGERLRNLSQRDEVPDFAKEAVKQLLNELEANHL